MIKKPSTKISNQEIENKQKSFIALAIHKLKTPISSMKLSLEMLLEGDFGELADDQKKIIERIYQRNNALIDLVNDLFELAKVSKKNSNKSVSINIEELIQSVIDYEQDELKKRAIKVNFEKNKTDYPKLIADKEGIFLAIQNIVDNAIKYSNIGGEVVIYLNINYEKFELVIKDCGIGIRDLDKENIFSEFFRGENAKEMHPMGSGLGLHIAKTIIEGHGGKITFDSKEHHGTTFYITLPVKP